MRGFKFMVDGSVDNVEERLMKSVSYDEFDIKDNVLELSNVINLYNVSPVVRKSIMDYYVDWLGHSKSFVEQTIEVFTLEQMVIGGDGVIEYNFLGYLTNFDDEYNDFEEMDTYLMDELIESVKDDLQSNVREFVFLEYVTK